MPSTFEFGDWIFLLTSVFEMLFFCGFQTGWSPLVYVLVEEGIYSHLCVEDLVDTETANGSLHALPMNATLNNCPAQQEMLNLAYTLATSVSAMAAFPLGIAIDHYGPRKVRVLAGIVLGLSCFLLSYLTKSNPGLLFIGLFVVCIANLMLYMTAQTCTNRFKKRRSIVIGLYSGAWVSSSLAFLCFKIFYEQGGVRFAHFFRFLAVSCVFICINAALLYPDDITSAVKTRHFTKDEKHRETTKAGKTLKMLSEFREKLEKCKSWFGVTAVSSSSSKNSPNNSSDTKEWSQLLPKNRTGSENAQKCVDTGVSEKHKDNNVDTSMAQTEIGENSLLQTKTVSNVSINHSSSSYVLRTSCDFKKLTYVACPPVNTNQNSMKTALSHTSLSDTQGLKSGDETDQAVEETKPHSQPSEDVKPCRSDDLQVWTAQTAESYLKSGLSYKHCALSTVHIWAEIFIAVCKLRTWFFVGTFSNFISELCGGEREIVTQYVNIFGLSHFGALIFAPMFGLIVDRQSRRGEPEYVSPSSATEKTHQKFMMGIEDTTKAVEFIIKCNKNNIYKLNDAVLITACAAALFCLLTLIPNLAVQIVTFQLYTFSRVAYNALFTSVLVIIFPPNHLGKLMGLASFLGAVFSLVQYPLFILMEECFGGRLLEVNVALWLLCMTTFGLPIYLWRKASSEEPHSLALVAV